MARVSLHTLTDNVVTPWGIYRAGLRVRVISRGDESITIDLSPRGMPPRQWTVGRPAREPWPENVEHGTRDEDACRFCTLAESNWQNQYQIKTGRKTIRIAPEVLADLYVHAAIPAQIRAEAAIGEATLSAAVYRHDDLAATKL